MMPAVRRGVLLLTTFLFACPPTIDPGECPPDSEAQQLAGKGVVAQRCQSCHSTTLQDAARQGAPDDLSFDDLEVVRREADAMFGQVKEGQMPPNAPLPPDEVEKMRVWLACGAE